MLQKVCDSVRRYIVSSILLRIRRGKKWLSQAIKINEQMKVLRESMGRFFMDVICYIC